MGVDYDKISRMIDEAIERHDKKVFALRRYRKVTLCKECCRKTGCMIRDELISHGAEEPMFCSIGTKTRWG